MPVDHQVSIEVQVGVEVPANFEEAGMLKARNCAHLRTIVGILAATHVEKIP